MLNKLDRKSHIIKISSQSETQIADSLWKWLDMGRQWSKLAVHYAYHARKQCREDIQIAENFFSTEFLLICIFAGKDWKSLAEKRHENFSEYINFLKNLSIDV